jgi:hypothetical protein
MVLVLRETYTSTMLSPRKRRDGKVEKWNSGGMGFKKHYSRIPSFRYSNVPLFQSRNSDSVKLPRIIVEDFLSQLWGDIRSDVDRVDELVLPGRIVVRVIGADKQMIFAGEFR